MVRRHASPVLVPSCHYLLSFCFSKWACLFHCLCYSQNCGGGICRLCCVRLWACARDACFSGIVDYLELSLSPPGVICHQFILVCRLHHIECGRGSQDAFLCDRQLVHGSIPHFIKQITRSTITAEWARGFTIDRSGEGLASCRASCRCPLLLTHIVRRGRAIR